LRYIYRFENINVSFRIILVYNKKRYYFRRVLYAIVIQELYYNELIDLVILLVVNIKTEVLFKGLVLVFSLIIYLKVENYKKLRLDFQRII
jgi:hypothetical protein